MKRALLIVIAVLALAPSASAHPLGNFSTNHLSEVRVSSDRVDVRYVLDQAEVPTVSNRRISRADLLGKVRGELAAGLTLTVDGRAAKLRLLPGAKLSFPAGQAGLRTTRFEARLRAAADRPRKVALADRTYDGRVGWKSVVVAPGDGTAVRTQAPTGDPTNGLRRYPENLLDSPLDRREASFSVSPGSGSVIAPRSEGGDFTTTRGNEGGGFASIFEDAASGEGVLLVLLLAAFGWGALHALSPGHGKAMVAAYLVGTRGTPRDAIVLGATVTVTHTAGVFALGFITLALSQYVLPEDLYPWLTLVSGLLVVGIGASVLRSRLRHRGGHDHDHHHHHGEGHSHGHHHHHHTREEMGWRGIIGVGAAAGLIPCPSALVVLLGAISQHEVALGLLLIVAFSVGLAATLTVLGLAVVYASRLLPRVKVSGRLVSALPAASAVLIVGVGMMLTARAVPGVL